MSKSQNISEKNDTQSDEELLKRVKDAIEELTRVFSLPPD